MIIVISSATSNPAVVNNKSPVAPVPFGFPIPPNSEKSKTVPFEASKLKT
jgi:hypothetical protein